MNRIAKLSPADRRAVFTQAGAELGMSPFFIEKDFWVCWTLQTLFTHPEIGPHLTFRGGTSLSKGWQVIERFSEDIDISMSRDWVGMEETENPAAAGIPANQREKRLSKLRKHCREVITHLLQPKLTSTLDDLIGQREPWKLEVEALEKARDPFCLHVFYPQAGLAMPGGNSQPRVKIELSGRADSWPMEQRSLRSYVAEALPHLVDEEEFQVSCVRPERTFLEKASLVHEQNTRTDGAELRESQSRHLYDMHRLWTHHGLSHRSDLRSLFDEVKAHRKAFFAYNWVDYDALQCATLKLVPPDEHLRAWKADYQQMASMFFGEPPAFDSIIDSLREIEASFQE
jgi:hypothetical protein